MNNILVIGAGRSASALINYLLTKAPEYNWNVTVADANLPLAEAKVAGRPNGSATWLDATKPNDRKDLISKADVVVSLLPVHLHLEVANDCIRLKKHLITASYLSKEMYALTDLAKERNLIFMTEMGLDPGVDHMSMMQTIHQIQAEGGKLTAIRSYTGGLVAPESDNNPWHYKISWNPRNVVLAGQGTAQYLEGGKLKYIPYNRIFKSYRVIEIEGLGEFEVYPNRDSLLYRQVYGIENIPNIIRGTMRGIGFCSAWNALVKIGLTDPSYPILDSANLTYHSLMEAFLPSGIGSVKERVAELIGETPFSPVMKKLEWLGLFSKKKINLKQASPATILQELIVDKLKLEKDDKDMVVMRHEYEYTVGNKKKMLHSSLVMMGENSQDTAMSKLVGLPLGIFVKHVMLGNIKETATNLPVTPEVYEPVLDELKEYGLEFIEKEF